MSAGIVIVGGGQAASSAAAKARELDADVPITMICGEPVLPYQRPPLSKKYLSGEMSLERLILRPQEWFDEHSVIVQTGIWANSIDRTAKTITLGDGETVAYDKLLLSTGSHVRKLPASIGGELDGVHCLRSTIHADGLAPSLTAGQNLVVIGGGYIGLEAAAIANAAGLNVTVVEMAERILQRVAAPETSDYFRALHTGHGVKILEGIGLKALIETNGKASGAELSDGSVLPADCVLCGIGILPTVKIAEEAGLTIDNGIFVDSHCRTSDRAIYAVGDCASFEFKGSSIRLESVPNAIHQAETAVRNMLGQDVAYEATPWFWSDQYDVKLQIAGLNTGYTSTVVRPGKREAAQSVWYYRDDQLLAVDAMNDAPAFMMARKIIEAGKTVPSDDAADPTTNLKDFF